MDTNYKPMTKVAASRRHTAAASSSPPTTRNNAHTNKLALPVISKEVPVLTTASEDADKIKLVAPVWNPYLGNIERVPFPAKDSELKLQEDDLNDNLLMLCCSALASVQNRALCPKEIAEVMMYHGWICTGTQPFAVVSSAIRAHLRRRGFQTCTHSNGKPAKPNYAPPIFVSYELTGPVLPIDIQAMGIDPDAKPAVKRGTLWYLAEDGTGFKSPFGDRDPNRFAQTPLPPPPKPPKVTAQVKAARRASLSALGDGFYTTKDPAYEPSRNYRADSPDDDRSYGLGRGKRKRKVSGIAGGDASWHSASVSVSRSFPSSLSTLAEIDDRFADAPASSSVPIKPFKALTTCSLGTPPVPALSTSAPAVSTGDELKVRLSMPPKPSPIPILSKSLDPETDNEDQMGSDAEMAAIERRRFKKRSRSDGSLLLFNPHAVSQFSSLTLSPFDSNKDSAAQLGYFPKMENAAPDWSIPRYLAPSSTPTSVANADLQQERSDNDDDGMDLDLAPLSSSSPYRGPSESQEMTSKPSNHLVLDDDEDDFHEAMLNSDFHFDQLEVSKRSRRRKCPTNPLQQSKTTAQSLPVHAISTARKNSPVALHEQLQQSPATEEFTVDTPATTPRSWSGSVKEDPDLYDNAARNHESGLSAQSVELVGMNGCESKTTLTPDFAQLSSSPTGDGKEALLSPAPDLPTLPIVYAANTVGFAPAVGDNPVEDTTSSSESDFSRAPSLFSHRSFSPISSFASPAMLRSSDHSRGTSPSGISETDSFDVNLVIKQEGSTEDAESPLPPFDDDDSFGRFDLSFEDDADFAPESVTEEVQIEEVDIGWIDHSGSTEKGLAYLTPPLADGAVFANPPPTPFGPEVFGVTEMPILEWKPARSFQMSALDDILDGQTSIEDLITVEVAKDTTMLVPESANLTEAIEDMEMREAEAAPIDLSYVETTDLPLSTSASKKEQAKAKPKIKSKRVALKAATAQKEELPESLAVKTTRRTSSRLKK